VIEARRIISNIAKLPELLQKIAKISCEAQKAMPSFKAAKEMQKRLNQEAAQVD
jgi:Sec-independent protein translocase protein TatA